MDTGLLPVVTEAGLSAELGPDRSQVLRHQPVLPDPAYPGDFGSSGVEFCFALTSRFLSSSSVKSREIAMNLKPNGISREKLDPLPGETSTVMCMFL